MSYLPDPDFNGLVNMRFSLSDMAHYGTNKTTALISNETLVIAVIPEVDPVAVYVESDRFKANVYSNLGVISFHGVDKPDTKYVVNASCSRCQFDRNISAISRSGTYRRFNSSFISAWGTLAEINDMFRTFLYISKYSLGVTDDIELSMRLTAVEGGEVIDLYDGISGRGITAVQLTVVSNVLPPSISILNSSVYFSDLSEKAFDTYVSISMDSQISLLPCELSLSWNRTDLIGIVFNSSSFSNRQVQIEKNEPGLLLLRAICAEVATIMSKIQILPIIVEPTSDPNCELIITFVSQNSSTFINGSSVSVNETLLVKFANFASIAPLETDNSELFVSTKQGGTAEFSVMLKPLSLDDNKRLLALPRAEGIISFVASTKNRIVVPVDKLKNIPPVYVLNNTGSFIRFRGTGQQVSDYLKYLIYTPLATYWGEESFVLAIDDILYNRYSLQVRVNISTIFVNQAPVVTRGDTYVTVHESKTSNPFNFSVADTDSEVLSFTLSVDNGLIGYGSIWDRQVVINGSHDDIEQTVSSLLYKLENVEGPNPIVIATGIAFDGELHSVAQVQVLVVKTVESPPSLMLQENATVLEGSQLSIGHFITVYDVDSSLITIKLSVSHGRLSTSLPARVVCVNESICTISNSPTIVNNYLQTINYNTRENWVGTDSVQIAVTDNHQRGHLIDLENNSSNTNWQLIQTMPIVVYQNPYPGTIYVDSSPFVQGYEGQSAAMKFAMFSLKNVSSLRVVNLAFTSSFGDVVVGRNWGALPVAVSMNASGTMFVKGVASDLSGLLKSGVFLIPNPLINGMIYLHAEIVDETSIAISSTYASAYLFPVNQAPTIDLFPSVPGAPCIGEYGCRLNLTISDPDASEQVCMHGNFFLVNITTNIVEGLVVSLADRGGTHILSDGAFLVFKVRASAANYKVKQIIIQPQSGWFGSLSVAVTVSDEGSCGGSASDPNALVPLQASANVDLIVMPTVLPPKMQFKGSTILTCQATTSCSLPKVSLVDDKQGNLLTVCVSLDNRNNVGTLAYLKNTSTKFVLTTRTADEVAQFISSILFTVSSYQTLPISVTIALNNTLYSQNYTVTYYLLPATPTNPFVADKQMLQITTLYPQYSIFNDIPILSEKYLSENGEDVVQLSLSCACCSLLRISLVDSISVGVAPFSDNYAGRSLFLRGFASAVNAALGRIVYRLNATCGIIDTISMSFSSTSDYSASVKVEFTGDTSMQGFELFTSARGYEVVSGYSVSLSDVNLISPIDVDGSEMYQLSVSSKWDRGDVVSTYQGIRSIDESSSKSYLISISPRVPGSKPDRQRLSFVVDWTLEIQSVIFSADSLSIFPHTEVAVSFVYGGLVESGKFFLSQNTYEIVNSFTSLLTSFANIGIFSIISNAAVPMFDKTTNLYSVELKVMFKSNAGLVPLLSAVITETNASASVKQLQAGSLVAEEQKITITSSNTSAQGDFVLLLTRPSDGERIQSAPISIQSSALQVEKALEASFPFSGLVRVSKIDPIALSTGHYSWGWVVTFLTYGGDVPTMIVLSSYGASDSDYVGVNPCLVPPIICKPFNDSSTSAPELIQLVDGTVLVGGYFRIQMGSFVTDPIASVSANTAVETVLSRIPGVVDVSVYSVSCQYEGQCTYIIDMWSLDGNLTQMVPVIANMTGTGLRAYVNRDSVGDGERAGSSFSIVFSYPNGSSITVPGLSVEIPIYSELEEYINSYIANQEFSVVISSESKKNRIAMQVVRKQPSSKVAWVNELPTVNVVGPAVTIDPVPQVSQADVARYLLQIDAPLIPIVNERQAISCRSKSSFNEASQEMFAFAFRFDVSIDVWIHAYISTEGLPSCSSVNTGMTCSGDGSTILEILQAFDTIAHIQLVSTNSTTGRLCPSSGRNSSDVFTSVFEFVPQKFASKNKVISGSTGDVPPILVVSSPLPRRKLLNTTKIWTTEIVRGSAADVQEVQRFSFVRDAPDVGGYFRLMYADKTALLGSSATERDFAIAVNSMIRTTLPVKVTRSGMSAVDGFVWTITFPVSFGRANLLQALSCRTNITENQLYSVNKSFTYDYWSGSSCMLVGKNSMSTERLVAGYSSLSGSLQIIQDSKVIASAFAGTVASMTEDLTSSSSGLLKAVDISTDPKVHLISIHLSSFAFSGGDLSLRSNLYSSPTMCAFQGSRSSPCAFPFILGGMQYSTCIQVSPTELQQTKYCTTGYDTAIDPSVYYGTCKPCVGTMSHAIDTKLSFLRPSMRWQGALPFVVSMLSGLTFIARHTVQNLGYLSVDSKLYDDLHIQLISMTANSIIADSIITIGVLQEEYDAGRSGLYISTPAALNHKYVYGVEDSLLFLNGFELANSAAIDDHWLWVSKVTVSISVLFGDIFLTSYENLIFSHENVPRNLTFSGSCEDVNDALSTLVYVPQVNWNSIDTGDERPVVKSSVYRVSIYTQGNSSNAQVFYLFLLILVYI